MNRILSAGVVVILLSISIIEYNSVQQNHIANSMKSTIETAIKQSKISHHIADMIESSNSHNKNLSNIKEYFHTLYQGQERLKSTINDPELKEVLSYMDMCLHKLKELSNLPMDKEKIEKLQEISLSLKEGNSYIANYLHKPNFSKEIKILDKEKIHH